LKFRAAFAMIMQGIAATAGWAQVSPAVAPPALRTQSDGVLVPALLRDLVAVSNHVPNRYLLSFQPLSPHSNFHVVELNLKDHPGMYIEARSGYWVDSESAPAIRP
jgi:hypothetical protein